MEHAPLQPCPEALFLMTKPMLVQPVFADRYKYLLLRAVYKGVTYTELKGVLLPSVRNADEINRERQVRRHELHQLVLDNLIHAYTYAEDQDIPGAYGVSALYQNSSAEYRLLMAEVMERYQKRFMRATKGRSLGGDLRLRRLMEATAMADAGLNPFYREEIREWYTGQNRAYSSPQWGRTFIQGAYLRATVTKEHPEWIWK